MIEVDISNVWGQLALPDLLAMEKAIFDAHWKLTEGETGAPFFRESEEELLRIQKASEKIRSDSEVCLVLGSGGIGLAARAAIELLQGPERNLSRENGEPRIFFAGDSLSTRRWKEVTQLLEDRDFSVIVLSASQLPAETGIALRGLRWMLERKYGTDEAKGRIYAVAGTGEGALGQMAKSAGWQTFCTDGGLFTAAELLPMAAAGIDIQAFRSGAMEAQETYDLRSYENPVWLYAAVRSLLCRSGRNIELLASFEEGIRTFGNWWQQRLRAAGRSGFPVAAVFPADRYALEQRLGQGEQSLFETLVRFAPGEEMHVIGSDWQDLDGLNVLAGKTLAEVEEQTFFDTAVAHGDAGLPVITMTCGQCDERTLGELFYFLELVCGISSGVPDGIENAF